ncbi:MAG: hypothetical protein O7G85_10285 [Planctomycetota bacterium]|nr:hypothetical protein [Planctomycetota bacterium]
MIVFPCAFLVINVVFLLAGILLITGSFSIPRWPPMCPSCGYSLIGHDGDHFTSPECGTRSRRPPSSLERRKHNKEEVIGGWILIGLLVAFDFAMVWFFLSIFLF